MDSLHVLIPSKTDPNDYEKILSELDDSIQKAQIRLSDIKIRERRTGVLLVIYSAILWLVYVAYCFFTLHSHDSNYETVALTIAPVVVLPVVLYYTRILVRWVYTRRQSNEEARLTTLRAQQKLKVEELKKSTAYYTTKSLLERYDEKKEQMKNQAIPGQELRQRQTGQQQNQVHNLTNGQQQQQQQHQQHQQNQQQQQPIALRPQPTNPQWYDKLVDALVGEDAPETKYALICGHCFAHNGLALAQEIETIQYTCPNCKKFNPSRRSRQLHPGGPVMPTRSPSPDPTRQRDPSPAPPVNGRQNGLSPASDAHNVCETTSNEPIEQNGS
ncbi:hypothetical protein CLU79DRAFT_860637 [Phycomyces nitens]|nr:hypothetical protein CLU79DRAFT_860637 [Phycomyces nitens]